MLTLLCHRTQHGAGTGALENPSCFPLPHRSSPRARSPAVISPWSSTSGMQPVVDSPSGFGLTQQGMHDGTSHLLHFRAPRIEQPLLRVLVLICRPCEDLLLVGSPACCTAPMGSAAAMLLPAPAW